MSLNYVGLTAAYPFRDRWTLSWCPPPPSPAADYDSKIIKIGSDSPLDYYNRVHFGRE